MTASGKKLSGTKAGAKDYRARITEREIEAILALAKENPKLDSHEIHKLAKKKTRNYHLRHKQVYDQLRRFGLLKKPQSKEEKIKAVLKFYKKNPKQYFRVIADQASDYLGLEGKDRINDMAARLFIYETGVPAVREAYVQKKHQIIDHYFSGDEIKDTPHIDMAKELGVSRMFVYTTVRQHKLKLQYQGVL